MAEGEIQSRTHDLTGALIGLLALGLLIAAPWLIDTSGPEPFYKGPLLFPLILLSFMILAALPFAWRLLRPGPEASWHLDGEGIPYKTIVVLVMLIGFLVGLVVVGMEISALVFMVLALWFLGHRSIFRLVVLPVLVVGLMYLTFKYGLQIWFPEPLLFEWLGGEV